MAILKCKMCGGNLEVADGMSVCECEYCGSRQTVPTADNEKKMNLFARANRLRFNCEFDKAAGIYESIVSEFPEETEAYWGLLLCKYGIEYVDDPVTGKKIPTCHRSSFESVMEDESFELACEYADAVAKRVYREQAKEIEELRKGIIEVSSKEEPYDIFICYKETDENGDRTIDSVIAQDIYTALTEKGYRVFFSKITLEDKLGQEYEPYIFAALHSAKVMLAVGTEYEYYDAVWVKNEWSRYLQLIAAGEKKTLIPCYKNLDAYDMPKEFARLQAQDMGKVGALQDLLRGVNKIFGKDELLNTNNASVQTADQKLRQRDSSVTALLRRGYDALEDGAFEEASSFFNKALNNDAELSEAYLGLFMAENKCKSKHDAKRVFVTKSDADNRYWKRAKQYAEGNVATEFEQWEDERNVFLKRKAEEEQKCTEEKRKRDLAEKAAIQERKKTEAEIEEKQKTQLLDVIEQIKIFKTGKPVSFPEDEQTVATLNEEAKKYKDLLLHAEEAAEAMPIYREKQRLEQEIAKKQKQVLSLGLFKGKEKKILNEQIFELETTLKKTNDSLEPTRLKIDQLESKYRHAQDRIDAFYSTEAVRERLRKKLIQALLGVDEIKVGKRVLFGRLVINGAWENLKSTIQIRWRVLAVDNTILLITEEGIGFREYDDGLRKPTWENCTLRKWLNNDFYQEVFSEEERRFIKMRQPNFGLDVNTVSFYDWISLLTTYEAKQYFKSNKERSCRDQWWLSSLNADYGWASYVKKDGEIRYGKCDYNSNNVRPVLCIDLGF